MNDQVRAQFTPEQLEAYQLVRAAIGSVGGKKAAQRMTPEQRSARARKAAAARHAKVA